MRVGQLVAGRYRLDEQIGAGGMGVVWRATDQDLQRTVALKRTSAPAGTEQTRRRADREARMAAALHHPNVVTLLDVVTDDDQRWLVLEYVPSRSLAEILRERHRLPVDDVARIGAQVAAALQAVHAHGLVHRDVKPGNILVTDDGVAKLTDFGISKTVWADVTATESGWIGGTPAYLAPEVARGDAPTAAADVFALGATMYAAVEGAPPFGESDNPLRAVHLAAAGDVTPPEHAGALAPALTTLLDADPRRRPSAADARTLLRGVAGGDATEPVPLPPAPRRRRRRTLMVAAASVAVLAVAAAVVVGATGRLPGGAAARSSPSGPPVAVIGDAHTVDPCGLLDEASLRRYGETSFEPAYGNFDRCDVIVRAPGYRDEIDVQIGLDTPDDGEPSGRREQVGGLTVFRQPVDDDGCVRVIVLGDDNRVVVIAKQDGRRTPKLCAIADRATTTALRVLGKGRMPRKPAPKAASLASRDACKLLDDDALSVVPGIDADHPAVGFGNWQCEWHSTTSDTTLQVRYDQTPPLTSDDGFPIRVKGRKAYVQPNGDGDGTCLARLVHRAFDDANGERTQEVVYLVVRGGKSTDTRCSQATSLIRSAAGTLPPRR